MAPSSKLLVARPGKVGKNSIHQYKKLPLLIVIRTSGWLLKPWDPKTQQLEFLN